MSVIIKTEKQIENIRYAAKCLGEFLNRMRSTIVPGISPVHIDAMAEKFIMQKGGFPAFKGFQGFPATICSSVNENVIHGIPNDIKLKEGDVIGVDIGMIYEGGYADTAYTFPVGRISKKIQNLLAATQESLYRGIQMAVAGNKVGDISSSIERYVNHEYGIIREYCGHGVGVELWEDPSIPNYGIAKTGVHLRKNMVVAIEPMLSLGSEEIKVLNDRWTVSMADGSCAAHYEHTVLILDKKAEILSEMPNGRARIEFVC